MYICTSLLTSHHRFYYFTRHEPWHQFCIEFWVVLCRICKGLKLASSYEWPQTDTSIPRRVKQTEMDKLVFEHETSCRKHQSGSINLESFKQKIHTWKGPIDFQLTTIRGDSSLFGVQWRNYYELPSERGDWKCRTVLLNSTFSSRCTNRSQICKEVQVTREVYFRSQSDIQVHIHNAMQCTQNYKVYSNRSPT